MEISNLRAEGVSVVGTGTMGAAYIVRLSALGVPVTVWNRTAAKAAALAAAHRNVTVAETLLGCVQASRTVLVACSPTREAVGAVCEQLASAVRDKHVVFIVDAGLPQARMMEEILFEKGHAASVTNAALFGTAFAAMEGKGAVINASGRSVAADDVAARVVPFLGLFGATTYHPGGTAIASRFAMAGHMAFMPAFYALVHYVALMKKSGIDGNTALAYFQSTNRAMAEGFGPMLAAAFEKHDYSLFFGSHALFADIHDGVAETCKTEGVDARLAELMAEYHREAMREPAVAAKSFHSVHELISVRGAK
ncbi:MAG TPA: NAD(P)-binding domain-containing protein [Labilithrix sp.]|jgi:3-hydroxyisobutyrate dehydrogenase-like beta-hydroxyacid dehydrogenase